MTSKMSSRPPARKTSKDRAATPATNASYSPSVPISVYRELAAELQATKVMVDSLSTQNQQLVQQNQQLRLEIEKVVQLSLHLQQIADAYQPIDLTETCVSRPVKSNPKSGRVEFSPQATQQSAAQLVESLPVTAYSEAAPRISELMEPVTPPEKLHTEQKQPQKRMQLSSKRASEMGGWWLAVAIVLIVMTAFGGGFVLVRALLSNR